MAGFFQLRHLLATPLMPPPWCSSPLSKARIWWTDGARDDAFAACSCVQLLYMVLQKPDSQADTWPPQPLKNQVSSPPDAPPASFIHMYRTYVALPSRGLDRGRQAVVVAALIHGKVAVMLVGLWLCYGFVHVTQQFLWFWIYVDTSFSWTCILEKKLWTLHICPLPLHLLWYAHMFGDKMNFTWFTCRKMVQLSR